jgi:hypothetical protein
MTVGHWVSALQVYAPGTTRQMDMIMVDLLDVYGERIFHSPNSNKSQPEWVIFGGGRQCGIRGNWLNTWLVLPEEKWVSRIDFSCSKCGKKERQVSLAHVACFQLLDSKSR